MSTGCFTNNRNGCGCNGDINAGGSNVNVCGCNDNSCGCDNARVNGDCGCSQNLLGCALGGLSRTLYQVINGLDNTLCGGCGCGRRYY